MRTAAAERDAHAGGAGGSERGVRGAGEVLRGQCGELIFIQEDEEDAFLPV